MSDTKGVCTIQRSDYPLCETCGHFPQNEEEKRVRSESGKHWCGALYIKPGFGVEHSKFGCIHHTSISGNVRSVQE